jgi:hypothetical protein
MYPVQFLSHGQDLEFSDGVDDISHISGNTALTIQNCVLVPRKMFPSNKVLATVHQQRCHEFAFVTFPKITDATFIHNVGKEDHGPFVNSTVWRSRSCNGTCTCEQAAANSNATTAASVGLSVCKKLGVDWTYSHLRDEMQIQSLTCFDESSVLQEFHNIDPKHISTVYADVRASVYHLAAQRVRLEPIIQDSAAASQHDHYPRLVDDVLDNVHMDFGQDSFCDLFHSRIYLGAGPSPRVAVLIFGELRHAHSHIDVASVLRHTFIFTIIQELTRTSF